MIEKHLLQGIRLKWNCPPAHTSGTKDGSIINDPARVNTPMTYDGIDGQLGAALPHVSTLGLTMGMSINYAWLSYSHGHTARRMISGGDILTGPMSGCLIVEWTDQGMRWLGHVGTVVDSPEQNERVKNNIGIALPTQARGFYPDKHWYSEIPALLPKAQVSSKFARPVIFGLVTTSCEFFSVLMFDLGGGEWVVGGNKRVTPINATQLRQDLLT